MAEIVAARRAAAPPPAPQRIVIRPAPVAGEEFTISREGEYWRVRGDETRAMGHGRPTSATPRPSATWPTG